MGRITLVRATLLSLVSLAACAPPARGEITVYGSWSARRGGS
jgi:hypothetical protein